MIIHSSHQWSVWTSPASAGSAPPRGDSAPVVLSQDRPVCKQWTSKPGNRNKNRKTSENGGFDAPCCEDTTTNNLPVKTQMRKKNSLPGFRNVAAKPGTELWLRSLVLSSPHGSSKQQPSVAQAPWIYKQAWYYAPWVTNICNGHISGHEKSSLMLDVPFLTSTSGKFGQTLYVGKPCCTHIYMFTCYTIHLYTYTHNHTRIHTFTHTCIRAYVGTAIDAYMHTCI